MAKKLNVLSICDRSDIAVWLGVACYSIPCQVKGREEQENVCAAQSTGGFFMLAFVGQGLNQFVGLMNTIRLQVTCNSSKDSHHDNVTVLFGSNATLLN